MSNFLAGYNYRKLHTMNGSAGATTGYVVKIKVSNEAGSDTADTVYLNGRSLNFPYDVTFTSTDNTEYNFWVDSSNTFYVKVNENLESNVDMYIYYSNSTSTSNRSNGANTFLLFDDFNNYFYTSTGLITEHAILKNNKLYISADGLYILNADTGVVLHAYTAGTQAQCAPVIDNAGKIHIMSTAGSWVKKYDESTGLERTTTFTLPDYETLTYDSINDNIIVQTTSGLKAIKASDHTTVWTNTDVTYVSAMCPSALIVGNCVYAQDDSTGKTVKALLTTGVTQANTTLNVNAGYATLMYDIDHNYVYAFAYTAHTVYCLNADTLATVWSKDVSGAGYTIMRTGNYHNNVLYVPFRNSSSPYQSKVVALDVTNAGNILWTNTTSYDANADALNGIIDDTYLYIPTYDYLDGNYKKVMIIKLSDGSLYTTYTQMGNSSCAALLASGGRIYLGMYDTKISQMIKIRNGGTVGDCEYKGNTYRTGYVSGALSGDFLADYGSQWNNADSFEVNNGTLSKYAANIGAVKKYITNASTFVFPLAIETRMKVGSDWNNEDGWNFGVSCDSAWASKGMLCGHYRDASSNYIGAYVPFPFPVLVSTSTGIVADTWYKYTFLCGTASTTHDFLSVNDATVLQFSGGYTTTGKNIFLFTGRNSSNSDYTSYFDYIHVRRWTDLEPTHSIWGEEEKTFKTRSPFTNKNILQNAGKKIKTSINIAPKKKVWI
ncbi:MAG: DUF2341 domain-containing protein [Bacteroidetes bacterium]|nr:MAG: DUF2341 domain-containing protein [Bacteroidota bacterium]